MGQPVAVVEKPSTLPGIVRFEANRTLTGMGHERFASADDAVGPRPAAELARRLFATGKVAGVHVYANMITVDLAGDHTGANDTAGLVDVVRDLHKYWMPGMEPPAFEDPAEEEPSGGRVGHRRCRQLGCAVASSSRRPPSACRPTCSSAAGSPASAGRRSRADPAGIARVAKGTSVR